MPNLNEELAVLISEISALQNEVTKKRQEYTQKETALSKKIAEYNADGDLLEQKYNKWLNDRAVLNPKLETYDT